MEIQFSSNRLRRAYEQESLAVRAWGQQVGRQYIRRLNIIRLARSFDDLYKIRPLNLHPLRGDREGQYGINLSGQMRLIVERADDVTLTILEVVDYHD